jgi:hypothetical protein
VTSATAEERKQADKKRKMEEREYTVLTQTKSRAESMLAEEAWAPATAFSGDELVRRCARQRQNSATACLPLMPPRQVGMIIDVQHRGLLKVVDFQCGFRGKNKIYTLQPSDRQGMSKRQVRTNLLCSRGLGADGRVFRTLI